MELKLTPNGVQLLKRNLSGLPAMALATLDPIMVRIRDLNDIIGKGVLVSDNTGNSTYVKVSREETDRLMNDDKFSTRSYWLLKDVSYDTGR